jgi:acyl carrier protein
MKVAPGRDDDEEFREGIRRELRLIMRQRFPTVLDDDAHYQNDLGLDSLDLVEMVARLEQATGIFVPDDDIPQLSSIAATSNYVRARRVAMATEAAARVERQAVASP